MSRSPRWRRNQRLKCLCSGYWFPHRIKGGACIHSVTHVYHSCRRQGMDHVDAELEQWSVTPSEPTKECPF